MANLGLNQFSLSNSKSRRYLMRLKDGRSNRLSNIGELAA
jgi:hypothetical protein